MADSNYPVGTKLRIHGSFTAAGVLRDPTTVHFKIRHYRDTVYTDATSSIVRDSTGTFHVDWVFSKYGEWDWEWDTVGVVTTTLRGAVHINRSKVLGSTP